MTRQLRLILITLLIPLPLLAQTHCDMVLAASHVLTMNESLEVFSPGAVAIRGDKIIAVGDSKNILSIYAGTQVRDFGQKLLLPGLINTHCHLPMILLRGMADAMDLVAKEQKLRENDPAAMKAAEVVRMATLGGAEALGEAKRLGSLEPGKQADLIVVDLQGANYGPVYDLYSHLVYTAHGEMVTSTMVAGKWLMLNNKLLTLNDKRLRAIVRHYEPLAKAAISPSIR